jgi:nucleotide-binding universal stress UspA family protein
MKSILVPVEPVKAASSTLTLAGRAAQMFESVVEGIAIRRPPIAALGWDPASVAIISGSTFDEGRAPGEAEALFRATMSEIGLSQLTEGRGPGWRWNATPSAGDEVLGALGRAFDLTVVSRPGVGMEAASITTLEAALFDSGGPILIAPPESVSIFGETVALAWNGSNETARTIAFAAPLLRRAKRVTVLADDGALKHIPSGELIVRRLTAAGIDAVLEPMPSGGIRSGEAILSRTEALGCDLLVKGAYTQSRIRQMIFGGATNHILAEARMPVFMAH